jgi:hypothetical protein
METHQWTKGDPTGKKLPSHLSPENLSYSTHASTLTAQAKKANEHDEK